MNLMIKSHIIISYNTETNCEITEQRLAGISVIYIKAIS